MHPNPKIFRRKWKIIFLHRSDRKSPRLLGLYTETSQIAMHEITIFLLELQPPEIYARGGKIRKIENASKPRFFYEHFLDAAEPFYFQKLKVVKGSLKASN